LKKICVLGLGYIGLPTAAMFATHGFQVVGVDVNERVVETLNNGEVHIHEPGLKTLVQAALKSGNLRVASKPESADVFIISVPTPLRGGTGEQGSKGAEGNVALQKKADLSYVIAAAESIVPYLRPGNLVVLESTVPPRTTVEVLVPILERSGLRVSRDEENDSPQHPGTTESLLYVAHCPERVLPGRILKELVHNDRVIGGVDRTSAEMAKELYASFVEGEIFLTDATTAEMVKLMENTYRDVNIALANEFALVAEQLGINVWEAIELANRHPRVNILKPGPGVGGHCIAVDPWFIVESAPDVVRLIRISREINDGMPSHVMRIVKKELSGIPTPVVTVLGIAYKGDVDDTRESPALKVVNQLLEAGYGVRIFDPHVREVPSLSGYLFALDDAVAGSDALLVLTDHSEFKSIAPQRVASAMRNKIVIDTRNCLEHGRWQREGFRVVVLGKGGEASGKQR
jgi:UDP-N-acetyl-D-mannosaminuronic acid dehydrogenase